MKISGRRPKLSDFLPKFARPTTSPEQEEALLKAQLLALSQATQKSATPKS